MKARGGAEHQGIKKRREKKRERRGDSEEKKQEGDSLGDC